MRRCRCARDCIAFITTGRAGVGLCVGCTTRNLAETEPGSKAKSDSSLRSGRRAKGRAQPLLIACATKPKAKSRKVGGTPALRKSRKTIYEADVHGTTCAVGFQLSEGGVFTRGIGGAVCGARDGGDGPARSRRSVWGAAILSGGEENFSAGAYGGRGDVGGGVEISFVGGNARRLPKSLPADYTHEIAGAQGRRACVGRRGGRKSRGAAVLDGREGRAAGVCARAGRGGKWIGVCAAALRNFRPR